MDVGTVLPFLIPGVRHGEESDLGAQQARVPGKLDQGFGDQTEQQSVNDFLVHQRQRS